VCLTAAAEGLSGVENLGIDEIIILKWICNKYYKSEWKLLTWLSLRISDGTG
jgi:hypothetical protein